VGKQQRRNITPVINLGISLKREFRFVIVHKNLPQSIQLSTDSEMPIRCQVKEKGFNENL
jgi:hypothetical protein